MSTIVEEIRADYLAIHVGLSTTVTAFVMTDLLAAALSMQLRMWRYEP